MNIEDIINECEQMQSFLEITTSDDVNELVGRLTDLNVYMARSGKLLADARQIQDKAMSEVFAEHYKSIAQMPATISQKFIIALCKEENYAVNWLDRINRACVHQSDNIRTQISFSKEQLKLTRNGY